MRKLSEKDIQILKKLAPETEKIREIEYRSILPPVSIYYAADEEDFETRLERLSSDDLKYLAARILDGSECLLCISPEYAGIFIRFLEKHMEEDEAELIKNLYESSTGYTV
jgi:hypothetical protein